MAMDVVHRLFEFVAPSVFRPVDILLKTLFTPPPDLVIVMPPGTIVPMGAYCFYCVRTYVRTYVRVWLKFLVKVLYWFKLYLMPSKHFRWTVYMLNFDIKINLDEFYF